LKLLPAYAVKNYSPCDSRQILPLMRFADVFDHADLGEEAAMKTPELAADIIAGSTVFAGLIIVYIGSVATAYASHTKPEQSTVRPRFAAEH
jgi:hypothetical protein